MIYRISMYSSLPCYASSNSLKVQYSMLKEYDNLATCNVHASSRGIYIKSELIMDICLTKVLCTW